MRGDSVRAMRFMGFPRAFFTLWLAFAALAFGAFEQRELGFAVIAATAADSPTPVGTALADSMYCGPQAHHADGHSHKGHADCEFCGFAADMAAFTLTPVTALPRPPETFARFVSAPPDAQIGAAPLPPYASRAPPVPVG